MAGNAGQVGIPLDEVLEHVVLLLVAGLQGNAVLPVALGVVLLILPQVIGLDAEQHIHVGQALGAEVAGLLPGPQRAAEVAVKADGHALLLGDLHGIHHQLAAVGAQRRGDAAQVQPVKAVQQGIQVHVGVVVLGKGAVFAVIGDLAGPDAVTGFQVIGAQAMGGGLLGGGENHGGAVHVVGAQPPHRAFAQTVVGHHTEKGAVNAQVGQCQRNVGLAASVAGLKAGSHADFFVVGRSQTQHDFTDGDEFLGADTAQQGIVVLHGITS